MIRFMQESAAFKKYALTAILVVICIAMAWYLVPAFWAKVRREQHHSGGGHGCWG